MEDRQIQGGKEVALSWVFGCEGLARQGCPFDHHLQLRERHRMGKMVEATIRADEEALGQHVLQHSLDGLSHLRWRFHPVILYVNDADRQRLVFREGLEGADVLLFERRERHEDEVHLGPLHDGKDGLKL